MIFSNYFRTHSQTHAYECTTFRTVNFRTSVWHATILRYIRLHISSAITYDTRGSHMPELIFRNDSTGAVYQHNTNAYLPRIAPRRRKCNRTAVVPRRYAVIIYNIMIDKFPSVFECSGFAFYINRYGRPSGHYIFWKSPAINIIIVYIKCTLHASFRNTLGLFCLRFPPPPSIIYLVYDTVPTLNAGREYRRSRDKILIDWKCFLRRRQRFSATTSIAA